MQINKPTFQERKEKEAQQIITELDLTSFNNSQSNSVENILSPFGNISNGEEFKKYKVVINGKKAKVISYTPRLGITVKFDVSGEIKDYASINDIETFKILKEEKNKNN